MVSLYPTHQLDAWYVELLACGAVSGRPLSANSVRHIHSDVLALLAGPARRRRVGHPSIHLSAADEVVRLIEAAQSINGSLPIFLRLAPVTGARRSELCALQMDQFIFTHDPEGMTPWRPDYATLAFARLAARLGIAEIRLHDLRRFAATTRLLNGIDVRTAAGRLGHASASTTLDVYAHYSQPADLRASDTLADSLDVHR